MTAGKKKLTHSLPGNTCSNFSLFYFASSPSPLCSLKETNIQNPSKVVLGKACLGSSPCAGCLNKVTIPCPNTGLSCSEQEGPGLGSTISAEDRLMGYSCGTCSILCSLSFIPLLPPPPATLPSPTLLPLLDKHILKFPKVTISMMFNNIKIMLTKNVTCY